MKVTVETTPWSDFQTKAFTEFNAQGAAYDMVVGDSQWLGAGSTGGPLRRPHRVLRSSTSLDEVMAPATVKYYSEYRRQELGDPGRGRRHRLGLPQGLVRGPDRDGGLQGQVRLRSRRAEGPGSSCATSPSSSTAPTRTATASPSTPTTPMTRWSMGVENAIFSYGGDLGDYATYKVDGHHQLAENVEALGALPRALRFHAAELGQGLLPGGQPGDHRGPGGDEHELLRLLPGARQPGDQPARRR